MRTALTLVVLLAACSDPTKVASLPPLGAIAGTILTQTNHPAVGVQVTIKSLVDTTFTAQDSTDSLGMFFQNNVPAGLGEFDLTNLPVGCASLLVAPFSVPNGQVDSTTIALRCGP